jgi:hypothetical protein
MNRLAWGAVGALVWVQGCELVAGVEDKYLVTLDGSPDAAFDAAAESRPPFEGPDGAMSNDQSAALPASGPAL